MGRSRSTEPAQPVPARLSPRELKIAITRLERRIADLEAFSIEGEISGSEPSLLELEHGIDSTLADIFGVESLEYQHLKGRFFSTIHYGGTQEYVENERQRALALFRRQIALMKEQLGDEDGSPADRAIQAYSRLDLHPEIVRAATEFYQNGHYANAIEDAIKALNAWVRLRSGVEVDGAALMQRVFSPNSPVLRFNDLADQNDKDEQQGFMMMFAGAVAGLRNPRAHKIIKDDPERALEFIAFISLLAKLVDEAKKTSRDSA
jgi:uncharacterized protein (TIGR02391 family)